MSNLSVASFADRQPEQLVVERIDAPTPNSSRRIAPRAARARQRALDRSRRNTNRDQYGLSVRQQHRAHGALQAGWRPSRSAIRVVRGARVDGVPLRAYRHDGLSSIYQRTRADHAADAPRQPSQTGPGRAIAARIVAAHGNAITVEIATSLPGHGCGANASSCSARAC